MYISPIFSSALLVLASTAQAEALITFEPIKAGPRTYDSIAINADDTVMFSPTNGGIFYLQDGQKYVSPFFGSCMQASGFYQCVIDTGSDAFTVVMEKKTRKGYVIPERGDFDSTASRNAVWSDNGPRLVPR